MTRISAILLVIVATIFLSVSGFASNTDADHRVTVHVDENDPATMNLALNNIANIQKYYDSKGETVEIELVANGPGLHMFRSDTSPVKDRLSVMSLEIDSLTFSACGNTHRMMSKRAGNDVELIEEATMVPSGVVQVIELQEQGYAYVKP